MKLIYFFDPKSLILFDIICVLLYDLEYICVEIINTIEVRVDSKAT